MSYEEYQRVDHEEPYVLHLCAEGGDGALLYFGSRHTNDPGHPQMERIGEAFGAFEPGLVLTEGGALEMEGVGRDEAVQRYGEFGLTRWLAREAGIPAADLDPAREEEIEHLRVEAGFTDAQLKLFYTLRQVSQANRGGGEVPYERAVAAYLTHLTEERGIGEGPRTLAEFEDEVARLLPDLDDWRSVPEQFFYPGPQRPHHFTNDVQTASNEFRDRHHVRRLLELVGRGRRVFAIVGSTHVVMQEPALRSGLSSGCR